MEETIDRWVDTLGSRMNRRCIHLVYEEILNHRGHHETIASLGQMAEVLFQHSTNGNFRCNVFHRWPRRLRRLRVLGRLIDIPRRSVENGRSKNDNVGHGFDSFVNGLKMTSSLLGNADANGGA